MNLWKIKTEKVATPVLSERRRLELLRQVSLTFTRRELTPDSALTEVLRLLCTAFNWKVGHIYYPTKGDSPCGTLIPGKVWYLENPKAFQAFKTATESCYIEDCLGIPGKSLATRGPVWIENVHKGEDDEYPRIDVMRECGIVSALAFPVMVREKIYGVLEFFTTTPAFYDEEILEMLSYIGELLGYFMERQWSDEALVASEKRFRSLFETSIDSITLVDEKGNIYAVNSSTNRMFGYEEGELVGKNLTSLMPERYHESHKKGMIRGAETGQFKIVGQVVALEGLRKNGEEFPMGLSVGTWTQGKSRFYAGIIREKMPDDKSST